MATGTTFTTLQEDVRAYLERGTATDTAVYNQLPRLINLAERNIATELKIEGFENSVRTTLVSGTSVYAKPDRWKRTKSITIGTGTGYETRKVLFTRGYEFLRSYWPDSTATGTPEMYADYGYDHWVIAPTPDAAYPAEIVYYELPELLSASVETNWLTDHAPQLLLYRTLVEASLFLKDARLIATWQPLYDRAAAMVNGEDLSRMLDRSSVRREA